MLFKFRKVLLLMVLSLVVNVSYAGLGSWIKDKTNQFTNWVVSVPQTVSTAVNTVICNEFMGGPETVCSGTDQIYYIGKKQYQSITWTTSSTSNIKSINGIDIEVLKAKYRQLLGLPSNFPVRLETFYLNTQNLYVNFTGSLTNDVVITAGANASAQATYNGTTVNLTGLQAGANASVTSTTKISTGLQLTATNITGGDPGSSISVSFDGTATNASVSVQATTSTLNPCGNAYIQKNIQVIPTPKAPIIIGVPANGVTCNSQVRLSTSYQNSVFIQWATEDAKFYNAANQQLPDFYIGTDANIGGFTSEGTKSILVAAYNSCGSATSSAQLQVIAPQIDVKADQVSLGTSFAPTCAQATNGMNISAEPWVSSNAIYSWDIPAGWILEGTLNVSTFTMVNGMVKYTYAGNNLRYVRLKRVSPNAPNGIITLSVSNVCGPNSSVTKAITLVSPQNIDITLPTSLVSCNSSVAISPILATTGTYPYTVVWSTAGLEGQLAASANQTLTSGSPTNTFNAIKYGNGSVSVRVTDARGCTATASTNVSVFGGEGSQYVSGWLSGHINPNQRANTFSNIVPMQNNDRIFFTRELNGAKQLWFYQFSTVTNKWELGYTGVGDLQLTEDNKLQYIENSEGGLDFMFYISNNSNQLSLARLSKQTGVLVGSTSLVNGLAPSTGDYGYVIQAIDNSSARVFYKNAGGLSTQKISIEIDKAKLDLSSFVNVASGSQGLNDDVLKYDFDRVGNRIFYFRNGGGFYMRKIDAAGNLLPEIKLNGILSGDMVYNVTDLVYETSGKGVYYVAGGDLFYLEFNTSTGDYIATYKVATRGGGVNLPSNLQQGANGYLAVNPSTNNLYYAGYDGNIYMVVKNANFATTTKTFEILKATPTSFYDNAANGLVYSKKHLYYKSKDNQVHNLFYIDIAGVATCIPKYLRQGAVDTETVSAELLEANNGDLRGQVFPNPTENTVTVHVYGKENELGTLEVFDMQGVRMHQENYNFAPQNVDFSNFDAGVYIIKVTAPTVSKPISFKVVKK